MCLTIIVNLLGGFRANYGPVIETFIANYGLTVKTFRAIKMLTLGTLLGAPCGRKLQRESEANNTDPKGTRNLQ